MIFSYRKLNGDTGQVSIPVDDDFSFEDAVAYMKNELMLGDNTRVLGLVTKDDYWEDTNVK